MQTHSLCVRSRPQLCHLPTIPLKLAIVFHLYNVQVLQNPYGKRTYFTHLPSLPLIRE